MTTLCIVLIAVLILVEIVTVPWFQHVARPGRSWKSRTLKMVCASCFLLIAILSAVYSGGFTPFSKMMVLAFVLSWLGDFFLHFDELVPYQIIGFLAFLSAHVVFIITFLRQIRAEDPSAAYFPAKWVLIGVALWLVACGSLFKAAKVEVNGMMAAGLVYMVILTAMLVNAVRLGLQVWGLDLKAGAICLMAGAFLFFASDCSMAFLKFSPDPKFQEDPRIDDFNIVTYFLGQTLLALSLLTIR